MEHLVCVTWIDHNIIILEVSDLQKNGVDYKVLGMNLSSSVGEARRLTSFPLIELGLDGVHYKFDCHLAFLEVWTSTSQLKNKMTRPR